MTHTSTEHPEALRLAELIETGNRRSEDSAIAAELRRLHARVQELEAQTAHMADLVELADYATKKLDASQAQRVPLNKTHAYEEHKKYPGACRHCGYAEHEPLQHGITQEKQG